MNAVGDFIRASALWVAMGTAAAILAARGAARKKRGKTRDGSYGPEGMGLGMCFGLLIGMMWEGYIGVGVSLGMLIGLVVGLCIPKKPEEGDK